MFDGADLSLAYGLDNSMDYHYSSQTAPQYTQPAVPVQQPPPTQYPPPPMVQQQSQVKAPVAQQMVSVQQPGELPYNPPEAMYMTQKQKVSAESFLDRLAGRKYEVLKVVVFAFIILFAISMDRLFTFYLSQYISQAILTKGQEFLLRASYPVAILLVIWFIKAM